MKALLVFLTLTTGVSAFAADDLASKLGRGVHKIEDADVGQIEIKVSNEAQEGYDVMTVSVLCNDRRKVKNAVVPKWEVIPQLNELAICYFREYNLNSQTKKLSVHYSMSSVPRTRPDDPIRPLGFECNNHVRTIIDLVKWCSPWR